MLFKIFYDTCTTLVTPAHSGRKVSGFSAGAAETADKFSARFFRNRG